MKPILPNLKSGGRLGVLGGGQLGRMFVVAARTMGYTTAVYDPDPDSPAGRIADKHFCANYDDTDALHQFVETCVAVTVEFENIPIATLEYIKERIKRSPEPAAFAIVQDRCLEKKFLQSAGIDIVKFCPINTQNDLDKAQSLIEKGAILKTAKFGYDGKGQCVVADLESAKKALHKLGSCPCILEERVNLDCEVSVVVVRSERGETASYPASENEHRDGILHTSCVPASANQALLFQARAIAHRIADKLNYCGVLAVEFFITKEQKLLVNEIAPRPHNSGHYTIDACSVSQFQQQVRMMCGLAPGEIRLLSPIVMVNLLGDVWPQAGALEPDWNVVLSQNNTQLHLYQKSACRSQRKMGHFCVLEQNIEQAKQQADVSYQALMEAASGK